MDLVRKFKNFKLDNLECRYGCDGVCIYREQNTCKCYAAEIESRGDECLAEKADVVVLLAGVNDVWHKYSHGIEFDLDAFSACYESVAAKIKESGAKLIIAEPFLLNVPDKKRFRKEFDPEVAAIKKIAENKRG